MFCRGSKYPCLNGGNGTAYDSYTRTNGGRRSASPVDDDLRPDELDVTIHAAEILPSGGPAQMSKFRGIASYNWLDSSEPTMLVPGCPAVWSPPAHRRRLEIDKGEVFIDLDAIRYSPFPLEPMFRAIDEEHPELDLRDVDVVICRNTMAKLYEFVTTKSENFVIDVEIMGDTALFVRKKPETTKFVSDFHLFGLAFPEEFTRWDSAVKGSVSHRRVVEYEFAGLKYLLRFESVGYLAEKAASQQQGGMTDLADATTVPISNEAFTVGEERLVTGHGLVIRSGGSGINQEAVIDITTRAAHQVLDMESVRPRLWMSQTPNLIVAYHDDGQFDDVQIFDVRKDLAKWEERNAMNLRKLDAVIRRIIKTVRNTHTMKCRVQQTDSGSLEICELDGGYQSALPDDLCYKLKGNNHEDGRNSGEDSDDYEDDRRCSDDEDKYDEDF